MILAAAWGDVRICAGKTTRPASLRASCFRRERRRRPRPPGRVDLRQHDRRAAACFLMGTEWEHPSRPTPSWPLSPRPARSRLTCADLQRSLPASVFDGQAGFLIICRSWVRAPPAPPCVTCEAARRPAGRGNAGDEIRHRRGPGRLRRGPAADLRRRRIRASVHRRKPRTAADRRR
jgi:hypothetical protein